MNPDSDSSNTGESQYPSNGSQFPSGGSQFGAEVGGGFPSAGDGGMDGGFGSGGDGGYQFPGGYPPFPGGYIPFPWSYPLYLGGGYPLFQGGYAGAGRPLNPQSQFGDNVNWPNMDGLADRADDSVPATNEFFSNEEFSMSGLDMSSYMVEDPQPAGMGSRQERGKGVAAELPQPVGRSKSMNYSLAESITVARCWVDVSEDPIVSNAQTQQGLWRRITERYERVKPPGAKYRNGGQLRKHFERMMTDVSKFNGIYENNLQMMTSGQSMDDVKELSLQEFSHNDIFPPFKYWNVWLILKESPKFQELLELGALKRTKHGVSATYRSNTGCNSSEINKDVDPLPSPPIQWRSMGQKTAMRKGKTTSSRSSEVQSSSAATDLTQRVRIKAMKALFDMVRLWAAETNPDVKKEYAFLIRETKRNLGLPTNGDVGDTAGDDENDANK